MTEQMDTLIIGGGQGGLATSYYLKQHDREHVILEQTARPASSWRSRWDSFTLITPNWMIRLPGAEYKGDDPDGFTARDHVVAYFEDYIERFDLPIRYGTRVTSVEPIDCGYRVHTNKTVYEAANVVVSTGLYQYPRIPPFSKNLPSEIRQVHSSEYRRPEALPDGAVLVVGSAQSGSQIAEELYQTGHKVYLSVSGSVRFPRRYRGRDVTEWFQELGFYDTTVDKLPSPRVKFAGSAHGTGKDGGHTISMHQFARDGVVLLGHIQDIQGSRIVLAPDLKESLAAADEFEADFVKQVDQHIRKTGVDAPIEALPELRDGFEDELIPQLDLQVAGITSVVWATGYRFDFSLVKLPAFDEGGYPVQERGVTEYPGLYFVGLPFLHTPKSGLLAGVGEDAAHVASVIATRQKRHPNTAKTNQGGRRRQLEALALG